jgi:RHS repeat-associated protein
VAEAYGKHFDELYRYDGVDQLVSLDRGDLNTDKSALVSGTKTFAEAWTLDATGNWLRYRQDTDGDGVWNLDQSRDHNAANEILAIAGSSAHVAHDRAGNMTRIPSPLTGEGQGEGASHHTLTYDAWNRLVRVADGATGQTLAEYDYDGRSFRTVKRSYTSGTLTETRHAYYADRWQLLEERLGATTTADRQFVWGLRYIDDLVLRDRNLVETTERLYALQDPNWNVMLASTDGGTTQERRAYSAYGESLLLGPGFNGAVVGSDWECLFAGCFSQLESHDVRFRHLSSRLGRWWQRDLAFPAPDQGSAYGYVLNNPLRYTDPSGLLPPNEQNRFQQLINQTAAEVQRNDRSRCAAFAYLMGKLYDMNLKRQQEGAKWLANSLGFPQRVALGVSIEEGNWYFTDHTVVARQLPWIAAMMLPRAPEGAATYNTPPILSVHGNEGPSAGFVLVPGDTDTAGRQDHFLLNAKLGMQGPLGYLASAVWEGFMNELSETDSRSNRIGLAFGFAASPDGHGFSSGRELAEWIYKNMCDESKCSAKNQGINYDGIQ